MVSSTLFCLASGALVYVASIVIYRLYIHPLSKFPGPRWAAVTTFYEFYYTVIHDGVYLWEIQKMHQQFGPIVRIAPNEIHINDPSFYDEVYTGSLRKRDKYAPFVRLFAMPDATLATPGHALHHQRRKILSPHFSKHAVVDMVPLIRGKVSTLMERLAQAHQAKSVVNLRVAFAALTADIISQYSSGADFGSLEHPEYNQDLWSTFLTPTSTAHLLRFLPFSIGFLARLPGSLVSKANPSIARTLHLRDSIYQRAMSLVADNTQSSDGKRSIFQAISDPGLPASERTVDRIQDELFVILSAGTDTTSRALSVTIYYLLENRSILPALHEELRSVMLDPNHPPSLAELEALPLLKAVIYEGLRLSFGTLTRMPRVATEETLKYRGWTIPPGTPVGETTYFIHTNPDLFPDPFTFDPWRWIRAAESGQRLERFLTNFTKGSRQCIGMNLVYAEFYIVLSELLSRFELELFDTDRDDVEPYRDRGVIVPKNGYRGIRVRVSGVIKE